MSKELVKLALKELASSNPEDSIKLILNHKDCQHTTKVRFALHCAKDSLNFIDKAKEPIGYKKASNCINLVERWLINPSSVSKKALEKAANAAYSAASAAASAADSAYTASSYNFSAYSAYSSASSYAVNAAYSAYSAVNAAHAFAHSVAIKKNKFKEYLAYLVITVLKENGENTKILGLLYENK